jgi:hypothetical protein
MVIYHFIKYLWQHFKYVKLLNKIYKNENLLENLSKLFGSTFKKDWIGRVYTIINPYLIEDEIDYNKQIFEYNENGLDNTVYIESYIMTKLNIAKQFIRANNLFDLLSYKIDKIDDNGNYLFIIQPITTFDFIKWSKIFAIVYGIILFLSLSGLIYYIFYIY